MSSHSLGRNLERKEGRRKKDEGRRKKEEGLTEQCIDLETTKPGLEVYQKKEQPKEREEQREK